MLNDKDRIFIHCLSSLQKQGSLLLLARELTEIPACAGMTNVGEMNA
jgi:hypothetical protein